MGDLIDNDFLISLVEARPVLWDKTLNTFKDRNLTRDAWREVCCALKNDFEVMEDKEKNAFGKEVTKRWGNLRDAFSKSKRKLKECKKSGAGVRTIKNYIYADQMQFLNKLFQTREVAESFECRTDNNQDEGVDVDTLPEAPLPTKETSEILEFQMGVLEVISKVKNKRKNTTQPQLLPPQNTFLLS
ncbi:hypothetical protein WA026_015466 [Henosepilachna vigintioctopunctata]|uniref:MADF domain-containing protein n=1 Tax=Henosepilachna vigintioctopunctata TaxID=420089 RepID=A0AAW1UPF8_9CUCU